VRILLPEKATQRVVFAPGFDGSDGASIRERHHIEIRHDLSQRAFVLQPSLA
jgi:hypothetical protein